MKKKKFLFQASLFSIILLGILMIYSSSSIWAEFKTGNPFYYVLRQGLFFIIGLFGYFIACKIDYHFWLKHANQIFFICLILLILVLIPGIGMVRGGARSWIGIGDFSIQPAEFMKIGLIIFTAKFMTKNEGILQKNRYFYLYMIFVGILFGLILLQPDFGSGMIMVLSIVLLLFIGGFQLKNIFIGIIFAGIAVTAMILSAPYRIERILSFLNPWQDPLGSGFQIIQSLYAIAPSSLFGYGLFHSKQKFFYLPEPQNDFIFSIICEELGMVGGLFLVFLFFLLIYECFQLAKHTKDSFAMYLTFGFTSLLFVQVFINIAVVIGLIPVTGVTLPFVSYGGSSLILSMFMMGIIQNIMTTAPIDLNYFYPPQKIKKKRNPKIS